MKPASSGMGSEVRLVWQRPGPTIHLCYHFKKSIKEALKLMTDVTVFQMFIYWSRIDTKQYEKGKRGKFDDFRLATHVPWFQLASCACRWKSFYKLKFEISYIFYSAVEYVMTSSDRHPFQLTACHTATCTNRERMEKLVRFHSHL